MKKALIIANMLFASVYVFGMPVGQGSNNRSTSNSVKVENSLESELWNQITQQNLDVDRLQTLINSGVNINFKNANGDTPLLYATKTRNLPLITFLLKISKTDVNAVDKNGDTALLWAIRNRIILLENRDVFSNLIRKIESVGEYVPSIQAFDFSNGEGHVIFVGVPGNAVDDGLIRIEEDPPANGQRLTLEWLRNRNIINGSNLNNDEKLINQLLTREDSNFSAIDKDGNTPLHFAVRSNDLKLVKKMLHCIYDDKADVLNFLYSRKNDVPWSKDQLQEHVDNKSKKISELLDKENKAGNTPLIVASADGHEDIVKSLVEYGANVNKISNAGMTPLFAAAILFGDVSMVETLCTLGADINLKISGKTLLSYAIGTQNEAMIACLVELGADVNMANNDGKNPLILAADKGNISIIEYLVAKGAEVNQVDRKSNVSPVFLAAQNGHEEIVKYLVECCANVNRERGDGATPLWIANKNGHIAIVKYLLEHGSDPNKGGGFNVPTQLTIAALGGNEDMVRLLVRYGADIHKGSSDGTTPLFAAVDTGNIKMVSTLKRLGADVNAEVKGGRLLNYAIRKKDEPMILRLVNLGADVNATDNLGYTPLYFAINTEQTNEKVIKFLEKHGANKLKAKFVNITLKYAIEKKNLYIAKYLLSRGTNANEGWEDGVTPLISATQKGDKSMVRLLLGYDAMINKADNLGNTPLTTAMMEENLELIEYLIEKGADINLQNKNNNANTPLHDAVIVGNKDIVNYLVKCGAYVNLKNNKGETPIDLAKRLLGISNPIVQILDSPSARRVATRKL